MANTGPRAGDEIKPDSWKNSRIVHDWIHASFSPSTLGTRPSAWGLNIATDHQQVRLGQGLVRAEMLRGTRFTSVKVVRGDEVTSMFYPPGGTYVFRYALSSGPGDWKQSKAYRTGMNWNNPLLPISVVDQISKKSLPPTQSFCSVQQDNLVISALKKADAGSSVLLRLYEMEGQGIGTTVEFLGHPQNFKEVNLLEEESDGPATNNLRAGPYSLRTLKFQRN
jgi:hypothetical protein